MTPQTHAARRRGPVLGAALVLLASMGTVLMGTALMGTLASCSAESGNGSADVQVVDLGVDVALTAAEVELIIRRAAAAIDSPFLHVAVVDRRGFPLGAFSRTGNVVTDEDNIALSIARTTAFFSNSQAPLSSRTVQFLSTFHFPPTFNNTFLASVVPQSSGVSTPIGNGNAINTVIAPQQQTTGIAGTPQGPLWQLNSTNRGAPIATNQTVPPTAYNAGNAFPTSFNLQGTFPSPGITLLPGGIPLYKSNGVRPRLVGGVGVFVKDPNADPDVVAAEFAAFAGASGLDFPGTDDFFFNIEPEGRVFLLGLLLPYTGERVRPAGFNAGTDPGPSPGQGWLVAGGGFGAAQPAPEGFLIGPRASPNPNAFPEALTQADVQQIITQCVNIAERTRAAIRFPTGSAASIIATITDREGLILAHFRMQDSLTDAVDVVPAKARSVVYYSQPGGPAAADQWPGFPVNNTTGVAISSRTLGFLSQPFYPPSIEGTDPGPLFNLALQNQQPAQAERLGNSAPSPGYQNGLTFFPGAVPLYKNGQLVGGLGVSGDGVEQNDFIAGVGAEGFEPPFDIRIDNFTFDGVALPYLKFPPNPTLSK